MKHILLLTKLKPIRLLELEVKKITFEDKYALTQEHIQFIKEGISGQEGLYFLIKNNISVSQAAIRRKVSIGSVYTAEKYRRNVYSFTLNLDMLFIMKITGLQEAEILSLKQEIMETK